jgi:hypothetical protein
MGLPEMRQRLFSQDEWLQPLQQASSGHNPMTGNQHLLARLRAPKPEQPGWWMVERDDGKTRPLYLTQPGGAGSWTTDWREGFKFTERELAEQQVELWHHDYGHVRSHGMMTEYYNPDGPEAADEIERLRAALSEAAMRLERYREALEAIIDRGPERNVKWAGMTARDIAIAALKASASPC